MNFSMLSSDCCIHFGTTILTYTWGTRVILFMAFIAFMGRALFIAFMALCRFIEAGARFIAFLAFIAFMGRARFIAFLATGIVARG